MSEQLRSARSQVLGVRSSAGPLKNVAISFGDGVTALYGRNGAGKTWALNAIRDSFAGHAAFRTHLLVSIPNGTEQQEWLRTVLGERSEKEKWRLKEDSTASEDDITRALRKWFEEVDRRFPVRDQRLNVPMQMIDELAKSQYLALVPTGVAEQRWDVWVCVDPRSTNCPVTKKELDRFEQAERTTSTLMDAVWAVLDDFGSPEWREVVSEVESLIGECQNSTVGISQSASDALRNLMAELQDCKGKDAVRYLDYAMVSWAMRAPLNWLVTPVASWIWQYERVDDSPDEDYDAMSGLFLKNMLNDGLPVPIARVAQVDAIPWVLHDESADEDVDALTARRFAMAMTSESPRETSLRTTSRGEPTTSVTNFMDEWVRALEADANSILAGLLQDGPELSLNLRRPHEWVISDPIQWSSSRGYTSVPISALSTAERRWAQVAVRRALDRVPKEPEGSGRLEDSWPPRKMRYRPADIVIIDEPETALHRAAERHMAEGLDGMTVVGPQVVVATHSPQLLNRPEARLVHVRRAPDGATAANQMGDKSLEGSVAELGMLPSDLIGMYRVFLLASMFHASGSSRRRGWDLRLVA